MLVSSESQTILRESECQTPLHVTIMLSDMSEQPNSNECSSLDIDFDDHALSALDVEIVFKAKTLLELTDQSSRLDQASTERFYLDHEARARFRELTSLIISKQKSGEVQRTSGFMEDRLSMIRQRSKDRLKVIEENTAQKLRNAMTTVVQRPDKRTLKLLQAVEYMGRERLRPPRKYRRRAFTLPPMAPLTAAQRMDLRRELEQAKQEPTEANSTAAMRKRDKLLTFLNEYIAQPRAIPIY